MVTQATKHVHTHMPIPYETGKLKKNPGISLVISHLYTFQYHTINSTTVTVSNAGLLHSEIL
jgi:hypothetical protein